MLNRGRRERETKTHWYVAKAKNRNEKKARREKGAWRKTHFDAAISILKFKFQ